MFAALAATRFAHFAAICLLFGLAAFPFYAGAERGRAARFERVLLACSVLALLSGGLEFLAMVGNMGDTWRSALDPDMLAAAATDTGFGRIWMGRLGLSIMAVGLCLARFPGRAVWLLIAATALLVSVALTGHSAIPGDWLGRIHEVADGVHLLAAGWWIGGLLALLLVSAEAPLASPGLLGRFSRIGYAAVALLIPSGLVKSFVLIAPISAVLTTAYGGVLLVKLGLFGAMGLLALSNRLQVTPALAAGVDPARWRARLLRQLGAEFALAMLVLAAVGALGAMSPPVSQ